MRVFFVSSIYCIVSIFCIFNRVVQCAKTGYILDDQLIAHGLTYHHLHPSPLSGCESHDAPGKSADSPRMLCGKVPVSPTGAKGSFPKMCEMGRTYST